MTARRFLRYIGAMFGMSGTPLERRIERLLAQFDLSSVADRRLGTFSSGMTQKVGLAQALINEPRVLLLDEPTSGLDPIGRHDTLELIRALAADGVTVLFSTHILSDIERVCERVAVLHHGRLIASGELDELKRRHGAQQMDELYLTLVKAGGMSIAAPPQACAVRAAPARADGFLRAGISADHAQPGRDPDLGHDHLRAASWCRS